MLVVQGCVCYFGDVSARLIFGFGLPRMIEYKANFRLLSRIVQSNKA
jgi:hypothetical protein